MLMYVLDKNSSDPVYIQIYDHIRQDIETGILRSGEKLPSKRAFSEQNGISISTVENAYGQLIAEGYIRSVAKKGYFVEKLTGVPVLPQNALTEEVIASVENPAEPLASLFPFSVWAKLMREELVSNHVRLATRPPAEGAYALRKAIAGYLKSFRNMEISPEQVIIGAGTEYLYILIRILLGEHSVMAVEEPGYRKIADIYKSLGMKLHLIPMQEDGIDMEALRRSEADVVHISPSHHFPTGVITSVAKRYALLGWASEGRYIIEDDYDSEFRLSARPIPSMFSFDVTDRVIYMNTFTKSLTPTIRIGYMILPKTLMKRFRERLQSLSCPVSAFEQYTLARFIEEGYFEKHIRRLRRHCKEGRERLMESIANGGIFQDAKVSGSQAGMHCVVTFQTDKPDREVLQIVREQGFHAALLSEYYRIPPGSDLHKLIIYY